MTPTESAAQTSFSPTPAPARELARAVADNLARLRRNAGIDVDDLAEMSGLPREQLLALEGGRATPSLRSLWALADAFAVPFGVLISGAPCTTTSFHVRRAAGTTTVVSAGGGFRTRPLSAAGDPREPEVDEVTVAPGWVEKAAAHAPDTFEHIVVMRGVLLVRTDEAVATLEPGDAVFFRADRPHAYVNPGAHETVVHLAMTYAGDWIEDTPSE
jgi:XRE family transcriptional regulator, regulator of sulfur utilization